MGKRCQFTIDPTDRTTWPGSNKDCQLDEEDYNGNNEQSNPVWHCPRRSLAGKKNCPFHTQKPHNGISSELAFLHTINGKMYTQLPIEERFKFFGSKLNNFSIQNGHISIPSGDTIKLSHSEFWTSFEFAEISTEVNIIFDGCHFFQEVTLDSVTAETFSFKNCMFWETLDVRILCSFDSLAFQRAKFRREAKFRGVHTNYLIFTGANFYEEANFIGSTADSVVFFTNVKFEEKAYLSHMNVDFATFDGSMFQDIAFFDETNFTGRADFTDCLFGSITSFQEAIFSEKADFKNSTLFECTFEEVEFKDIADFTVRLDQEPKNPEDRSIFNDTCVFSDAHFGGKPDFRTLLGENKTPTSLIPTFRSAASFRNVILEDGGKFGGLSRAIDKKHPLDFSGSELGHSSFQNSELDGCRFVDVNLTDSNMAGISLVAANLQRANLTRVNLFNATLYGSMIYSSILSDVQIDENTSFGGHYIQDQNDIGTTSNSNIRKAIWSFRAVEQISYSNALTHQGRSAYISRKEIEKGLEKKKGNNIAWFQLLLSKHFWKYGEGIFELGLVSSLVVFGFAVLYSFQVEMITTVNLAEFFIVYSPTAVISLHPSAVDQISSGIRIFANGLYLSLVTFTTLGSSIEPTSPMTKVATSIQSLLGNILFAAFIFVLGRRATR